MPSHSKVVVVLLLCCGSPSVAQNQRPGPDVDPFSPANAVSGKPRKSETVDFGNYPDGNLNSMKSLAEFYRDTRTVEQIQMDNAMVRAAWRGDVKAIRNALRGGSRVNALYLDGTGFLSRGYSGYTALMMATLCGHTDAVRVLLENGADPNVTRDGRTALHMAMDNERDEVVTLLRHAGARGNPAKIRMTGELIRAACKGFHMRPGEAFPPYPGVVKGAENAASVVDLLRRGADVNATAPNGFTPLMYAANLGLLDNVKALVAGGADASLRGPDGETALSLAERPNARVNEAGRQPVAEFLRRHPGGQ